MSRPEIGLYPDRKGYSAVGRKYLKPFIQEKMIELEELGADIGDIYMNHHKQVMFRTFLNKPIWFQSIDEKINIFVYETDVRWISRFK